MQMDDITSSSVDAISHRFNKQLQLDLNHAEENCDNDEQNEDVSDDDDFTFVLIDDDESQLFEDVQMFPLFDQKLLLDKEYEVEEIDRLPIRPPVDNIFIQSPRENHNTTTTEEESYCNWSKKPVANELSKKSNSTGFSKLWRLKEIVSRSNSSGRDAFVFIKSSDKTTTTTTTTASASSSSSKGVTGDGKYVKARVVKQGTKGKKPIVSSHEAYLKSKVGHTEEGRRRSYLPYRPELMGFFTNVHGGGLTKNVHPY